MDRVAIDRIRLFNRTVGERIGTLSESFLDLGRPYGESRVLWEIGPDGAEVRELRARLGLDSGYTSRMLRSLRQAGLIELKSSATDKRVRRIRRTPAGERAVAEIERRSDARAWSFLEPLDERNRAKLIAAMAEVERLLHSSLVRIEMADPRAAESRWCLQQYFTELERRFESGFKAERSLPLDDDDMTPPAGALLIARVYDRPVGCGALKLYPGWAYLKRMWVAQAERGRGIGRRLLLALEGVARERRIHVVRLETNRALSEAIALYHAAGYHEVAPFNEEPYAHHWFEKTLA